VSLRLEWSPEADTDLREMWDYIAQDNVAAADRLLKRLIAAGEVLVVSPKLGRPGCVSGTRELPVTGTKYLLIYTLRPRAVRIQRVLHGARRWPPTR
jgi:addiction module RelE/StbE family toxin